MFTWDESPPWATNNVGCSGSNPVQCTGPITDYADFDAFVSAVVQRYGKKIQAYEILNESDYSGTPSQLAEQAEHFVTDIHAVNPNALIVAEIIREFPFGQFWAAWNAMPNNHAHLDAVAYHGYSSPGGNPLVVTGACGSTTSEFGSSSSSGYIDCVRRAIAANTLPANIPIWDTEGSWGGAPWNKALTMDQKEAYIGQYYLLIWSLGVTRQVWYAWDNQEWGTLCIGRSSCTPTAAATAYQQIYNWMVGSVMNVPCSANGRAWTCGLINSAGVHTQAVWNTAGSSSHAVPAGYGHYQDLAGKTNAISGGTIVIGMQPILLIP
jgi:hypothetical protein